MKGIALKKLSYLISRTPFVVPLSTMFSTLSIFDIKARGAKFAHYFSINDQNISLFLQFIRF